MITRRSLFFWSFHRFLGLQSLLLLIVVVMVFARVFPLEMQKRIVNVAIRLKDLHALYLYCGLYITAVVLAGSLKYLTNVLQTYIGQKILLEIRSTLYDHIIRLPLPFFRRTAPGLVISSLTSELSSVGSFLGGALAIPMINILTLLTFAAYMLYLNPLLAVISLSIYPLEILVIPFLQNRYNRLNRRRIDNTRTLSGIIGEVISGMQEVHGNGSYPIENRRFGWFASILFHLRYRMDIVKYGIKFVNNLFQSLGPFILFLLGGYLSIKGRFDLGALVAFLSAYEKLYDPWKELMDYYQALQDARVRYYRVMSHFDVEPEFEMEPENREPYRLKGQIEVNNLTYTVEENIRLLDGISLSVQPGEQLALVGFSGSGKSTLAMILGQIYRFQNGKVRLDGHDLETLTKRDVVQNIGFVAQQPFIFDGTLQENLLYACDSLSETPGKYGHEHSKESGRKGLSPDSRAGESACPGRETIMDTISKVGLFDDVLRLALGTRLAEARHSGLVPKIIHMRELFYDKWSRQLAHMIEFFDVDRYLYYCDLYCNLTFGNPNRRRYHRDNLPADPLFRELLSENHLMPLLLDLGEELARQTVTLLMDLREDAFFFEKSPIGREEIEFYRDLIDRLDRIGRNRLGLDQKNALLRLALRFIPTKHKMAAFPNTLEKAILETRPRFMKKVAQKDPQGFNFYRPSSYLYNQSILDNILFGNLKRDNGNAADLVQEHVVELLQQENLMDEVMEIGLQFRVGSAGDRLSGGQKQKIALARALLKEPPILILDEASAALDNASQARIQRLLESDYKGRCTLVSVAHRLDTIQGHDHIAVMKAGKIIEQGTYQELMERKGAFYELAHGN